MKSPFLIMTLTIAVALFPSISNTIPAQPIENFGGNARGALEPPLLGEQVDSSARFDLAHCQWECRIRYGYDLPDVGGRSLQPEDSDETYRLHEATANYYQYYACLEDCSRRHWQEFEKK